MSTKQVYNDVGLVVDDRTGEFYKPESEHYRITVEELYNEVIEEQVFLKEVPFTKVFYGMELMISQELSNAECRVLWFLMAFICYKDCILRKNGNSRGKALNIHELAELYEANYDSFRKTLYSLRNKEVLIIEVESKNVYIIMNPFIFCRGVKLDIATINRFKDTRWAQKLKLYYAKKNEAKNNRYDMQRED